MGYIKKLKNNELVGGTDKTTIYPVTSTKAVFEEVSENNFQSQEYLNNHIYGGEGGRINEESITDYNIATGTITKGKLSPQVQTMLDEGQKKALSPKGNYNPEEIYEALDLVFDPATNSSYVSLITPNAEPLTNENAWEMFLDGTAVNTAQATINDKVEELDTQVTSAIGQANQDIQDLINASQEALQAATDDANDAAEEARDAASTVETLTSQQVADAQIGYFECTNTAASGAAANETKITTTATIGTSTYTKTVGSHVKVKLAVANAHVAPVYLQFGSNTATRAQLYYNGEPASASNSWEDGETISVYYDGTYYQASNVQGGGSSSELKRLKGSTGYLATNGDFIGEYNSSSNYKYIKYPVNPGDVVKVSGKGATTPRLWAIADINESIISRAESNLDTTDLILTMPAGAKWIVLNNNISVYPNYEWCYAKADSVGAHKMLTEPYLYEDLRTLAVGQVYKKDEAVKTADKQLLRMTKDVNVLSLSETLVTGDIKVSGSKTYRAASAINTFNPSTSYSAGAYALGSMTVYTLTVSADTVTAGNITVNGTDVTVEETDTAATIATKISSALNIDGWTDSASENVVTVRCNTIGNNTTTITITDTDNTGVAVASSSVAGTSVIRKYDGETWTNASVSEMVTDGVLIEVDVAWLIANATQQNSVTQDIKAATTYWEDINIASIANSYVGMFNSGGWKWQNSQDNNYGKFVSIEPGRKYKMVGGISDTNYALLKNNTHVTGNVTNFATGETGRTLNSNATVIITPPADAKYLYFRTNSNGGLNRTPQSLSVLYDFHDLRESYNERFETIDENLETLDESIKDNKAAVEDINNYPNIIITEEESVDITSLEERDCSLGSNRKWYYNGSVGKHKIIEVTPDNIIGIKVSGMNQGFYGWLTPSYTSPSNNDIIPYAVGTTRGQLSKKDSYTYLRVPINAKYLVICTVDGGSGRPNWEVANCTYKYRHNNFTKFRFAHWNIGHFSGYDGAHASSDPTITPENAEAMARRYKQVINDVGADILGIAEYDPNFTTDGQKAKDVIFQCYNKILEGTKQTYNCNTLMFNGIKYINNYEIQYTSRNQSRYIKLVKVEIGGRSIYIVETHWDFDTTAHKRSQATQLLNLVQDCQYVIISGDLNTNLNTASDIETLQMFKDAGFEFANNGYLDHFTTATNGGSIDHIMVKGFSMSNRHTVEVSGTLSDHYLLYCDLVMNL